MSAERVKLTEAQRALLRAISDGEALRRVRDLIPMSYLEAAGSDIVKAMRAYSKDRWTLIERLKAIEAHQERDSFKVANEGWKRAFNSLHETLEKIAGGSFPGASTLAVNGQWQAFANTLQDMARDALHTEEA